MIILGIHLNCIPGNYFDFDFDCFDFDCDTHSGMKVALDEKVGKK